MRVASLFPSATEIVAAIDATPDLAARSHRCNYPSDVRDAPVVTASALEESTTDDPGSIDATVDDHHHGDGTFFRVDTDALRAARPDVLITQSLCEVCAVPESMTAASMEALETDPELLTLGPESIDGIFDSIRRVGAATGRDAAAERVVADLRARVDRVLERRPEPDRPPRVVCLEWTDAPRCHGLWMPEIVERLGAEVGFGEAGAHGRVVEWDDVIAYDPDVLIVSPCGRSVSETRHDMEHLLERDGWNELRAVRSDEVYLLDGELSSRHGPRAVRAMELVASMLYPDEFADISWTKTEAERFFGA